MEKEELTRGKIFSLTSSHRFYANVCWFMAIVCVLGGFPYGGQRGVNDNSALLLIAAIGPTIVGVLCCLTYFIDILTMNIKTVEQESKKGLTTISHAKVSVGGIVKVTSPNGSVKKLSWYNKVYEYSYDRTIFNTRYDYKTIWYYLGLSKVVIFTEYIPIGEKKQFNPVVEKKKCNTKKRR